MVSPTPGPLTTTTCIHLHRLSRFDGQILSEPNNTSSSSFDNLTVKPFPMSNLIDLLLDISFVVPVLTWDFTACNLI